METVVTESEDPNDEDTNECDGRGELGKDILAKTQDR